jgi:hypothetical protein
MANNSINLATLDVDTIKANLRAHLKSQPIFKDFNFEGSNISVLIDLLAYNTSLQSYYQNMLASESFLDSAQLRSSVLSHAKELNYKPRSARSAMATIRAKVEQNNNNTLTIPKGTSFTATYNFQTYSFTTNEVRVFYADLDPSTGTYKFDTGDFNVYEGFYVTETFVMDYSNENLRFVLSNDMIDTSSMVVTVFEDGGSTVVPYSESSSLLGLTNESRSYFIQTAEQEKYEVLFGDDIIGRKPADGSTVAIQYRVSSGELPNGATLFASDADLTSDNSGRVTVLTVSPAVGGAQPESTASIKFNAPRYFQTQERAITISDYETLMKTQFPEIDAISVYGGEDVSPPQYGKVFLSVSVSGLDSVPESKKDEYFTYLKPKMANPIQPVFVDPSYVYARVDSNVKYNLNVTTLKPDEINLIVANAITQFNGDNLNDFNATLYGSKLVASIDNSHPSIVSNNTEVFVFKKFVPQFATTQNIDINFGMALRNDIPQLSTSHIQKELKTLFSSSFTYNGDTVIIEDDGVGGLRLMRPGPDGYSFVKNTGTIDYATGKVQITNLVVEAFEGYSIRLYARTTDTDITSSFNDILRIEPSEIHVNVEVVRN